jgi:hypothetical protein
VKQDTQALSLVLVCGSFRNPITAVKPFFSLQLFRALCVPLGGMLSVILNSNRKFSYFPTEQNREIQSAWGTENWRLDQR